MMMHIETVLSKLKKTVDLSILTKIENMSGGPTTDFKYFFLESLGFEKFMLQAVSILLGG